MNYASILTKISSQISIKNNQNECDAYARTLARIVYTVNDVVLPCIQSVISNEQHNKAS